MFGLFKSKEREWARQTEDTMAFLLAFKGEKFVKLIYQYYPRARKLAIEKAKAGEPLNRTASEILRIVLASEIGKLSYEQQAQVAAYMATGDEAELRKPPFMLAELSRAYATMMLRQSDQKQLDEQWAKECIHDVYSAAKGMNAEERSNDRMLKALERALSDRIRRE